MKCFLTCLSVPFSYAFCTTAWAVTLFFFSSFISSPGQISTSPALLRVKSSLYSIERKSYPTLFIFSLLICRQKVSCPFPTDTSEHQCTLWPCLHNTFVNSFLFLETPSFPNLVYMGMLKLVLRGPAVLKTEFRVGAGSTTGLGLGTI